MDEQHDSEIIEVLRGVPLDVLATAVDLPTELRAQVADLVSVGTALVDVAEIATADGWELVVIPLEPDTFIPSHDYDEDDHVDDDPVDPPEVTFPAPDFDGEPEGDDDDDLEYVDPDPYPHRGLLDRLRSMFGKAVSFESENASIARNRKRAAARAPHQFQRAVWATRKGVVRCRVCGGPSPVEGDLCAGAMAKDATEIEVDTMDGSMSIGELTIREAALATAYDEIADALGPWSQNDAHLMLRSPFVDDGICCDNCVAYCPAEQACDWVGGPIPAAAVCKLWVIPGSLRKDATPVPVAKEIVEVDGEFCVTSADGAHEFGCYPTLPEAEARLAEIERFSKADTYTPPAGVREEAQRAVRWIEDGQAGANFTAVGRRRASDLAAGRGVSLDTVQRMASYLARHEVDKQGEGWSPGENGYPSPGRVAWAAWGGDPAVSWTRSVLDGIEKDSPTVSDVHVDVPMGSGGRRREKRPAAIPSVFAKADARRYTLGPWYVPDSYDAHGEWTDANELQPALWDYVRNGDRSIRLQHDTSIIAGEWVEALTWPYPVCVPMLDVETGTTLDHEFPAGTVFMGVVWEPWAWDLVQQGKIRGYSMGGRGQRVAVDLETEGTEL